MASASAPFLAAHTSWPPSSSASDIISLTSSLSSTSRTVAMQSRTLPRSAMLVTHIRGSYADHGLQCSLDAIHSRATAGRGGIYCSQLTHREIEMIQVRRSPLRRSIATTALLLAFLVPGAARAQTAAQPPA